MDNEIKLVISEYSATGEGVTIIMLASRGSEADLLKKMLKIDPYFGMGATLVEFEDITPQIKNHLPNYVYEMLEKQTDVHFVWHSITHTNAS